MALRTAFKPLSASKPTLLRRVLSLLGAGVLLCLIEQPALAHHPLGGAIPANAAEGFLSGLAHPVIGLDHFAFVVASGLLASLRPAGFVIPIAFVLASLGGTGLHLAEVNLPLPEVTIALSVAAIGLALALPESLQRQSRTGVFAGLGAIAGLFHGYAYGEAIVGAEMSPLIAYLIGFTVIQLAIALSAWAISRATLKPLKSVSPLPLRFAGFLICGAGLAFLSNQLG